MSKEIELEGVQFPEADWEATPESIKQAVRELVRQLNEGKEKLEQLSQRVTELEEKQSKNSKNSSQPPSKDGFGAKGEPARKPGSRRRKPLKFKVMEGKGERGLYEPEACRAVYEVKAEVCPRCGEPLSGVDEQPYRHQVVDVPEVKPFGFASRLRRETLLQRWTHRMWWNIDCISWSVSIAAPRLEPNCQREYRRAVTECGWQDG